MPFAEWKAVTGEGVNRQGAPLGLWALQRLWMLGEILDSSSLGRPELERNAIWKTCPTTPLPEWFLRDDVRERDLEVTLSPVSLVGTAAHSRRGRIQRTKVARG